jgi:class 3 adenylate cyclase
MVDDLAVLLSETFAGATSSSASRPSPTGPGEPDAAELPAGTLTFLLTDIEGSTRLWESEPEAMEVALQRHDHLLAEVIESHGGSVITSRGEGDSFFAVFHSAVSAVEAAGICQLRLGREVWPTGSALQVRMGCTPGKRVSAAVIMSTTRRSTVVPGCGPQAMVGRCCSPKPRGIWWQAV